MKIQETEAKMGYCNDEGLPEEEKSAREEEVDKVFNERRKDLEVRINELQEQIN